MFDETMGMSNSGNSGMVEKVAQVIAERKIVTDNDRILVEFGGDVGDETRNKLTRRLNSSLASYSEELGVETPIVGCGMAIVSGEMSWDLGLGFSACVNYPVLVGDKLGTEATFILETSLSEFRARRVGLTLEEQLTILLDHEIQHAVTAQYCTERGVDVHDPKLRLFSELLSTTREYQDRPDVMTMNLARIVNAPEEDLQEKPPESFSEGLSPEIMYNFLPSFFGYLTDKFDDPCLVVKMFKERVDLVAVEAHGEIKPEMTKIDPEVAKKMVVLGLASDKFAQSEKLSEIVDYTEKNQDRLGMQIAGVVTAIAATKSLSWENSGTYGGDLLISPELKEWINIYLTRNNGTGLEEEWVNWRKEVMP